MPRDCKDLHEIQALLKEARGGFVAQVMKGASVKFLVGTDHG